MNRPYPAKLLRIHISESDRCNGAPLYEAIVQKCRELQIAGATVFRGLEGYGESGELHRSHWARHAEPIVVAIVDTAENLAALAAAVEPMMDTGLLSLSDVQVVRKTRDH
jgi:PII-like signaling protein